MNPDPIASEGTPTRERRLDWRIWLGLGATLLWLGLGLLYLSCVVGWGQFVAQPASSLGSFLEGAFAPLAFLWLVIGFFLQQRDLAESNRAILLQYEALERSAEQAEIQARAIADNALHQRQETLLRVADRVHEELGIVAGLLFMSSQADELEREEFNDLWAGFGRGDPQNFARRLLALHLGRSGEGRSSRDLFLGTETRRRHSQTILHRFDRLLTRVTQCDPDDIIADALRGSGHGRVAAIIRDHLRDGPPDGDTATGP